MSIAPPSDIILDVAQAADPLKLQAAQAKLAQMSSGGSGADFSAVLDGAAAHATTGSTLASTSMMTSRVTTKPASPYQKFEAVMLQNFLQDILPKDENLFGDAASADVCRSLLAEQLSNQLAKSGKFGIAHTIEAAESQRPETASAGVPRAPSLGPDIVPSLPIKVD